MRVRIGTNALVAPDLAEKNRGYEPDQPAKGKMSSAAYLGTAPRPPATSGGGGDANRPKAPTRSRMELQARAGLRNAAILSCVPDEQIDRLAERATCRKYGKNQTVFVQGDPGHHLYVMASGMVKLVRLSPDGDGLLLGVRKAGDSFGEVALFDQEERAAQAEAVQPSTILRIHRNDVLPLVREIPGFAESLLKQQSLLMRQAIERAFDFVYLDLKGRVAKMLVYLSELEGADVMELELHQGELASIVGGSRPAVNQILKDFEQRGYVRREGRTLLLKDPDALSRRARL